MGFWFKKEDINKDKTEEYDKQPLSEKELDNVTGGWKQNGNGGQIVPGSGIKCGVDFDS